MQNIEQAIQERIYCEGPLHCSRWGDGHSLLDNPNDNEPLDYVGPGDEDPNAPTAQELWEEEMEYDAREYLAEQAAEEYDDGGDEW